MPTITSPVVDVVRIEGLVLNEYQRMIVAGCAVKAGLVSGMAGWAMTLAAQQDHILVTIHTCLDHQLVVAGRFTLNPDCVPAT